MTANDIIAEVQSAIEATYPNEPVYTDYMPVDFERPSFAIELRTETASPVNIALIQYEVTLLITCFDVVDDYHDSDRLSLNDRQNSIMGIFGLDYLRVGDRVPKVRAVKGTGAPDFAEVTATFIWTDVRPGYTESDAPYMGDYTINQTMKG